VVEELRHPVAVGGDDVVSDGAITSAVVANWPPDTFTVPPPAP